MSTSMNFETEAKKESTVDPLTLEISKEEGQAVVLERGELPSDRFNIWNTIGVQFSVTASPLAIGIYLQLVMGAGGSSYFFWCLLVAMTGQFLVAFSLAELSSVYPHAAGTPYWVSMLAPRNCVRFLSYWNGISTSLGWLLATCGTAVYTGIFLVDLGIATGYNPKLWHIYLAVIGVMALSTALNTIWIRTMPALTKFIVLFLNAATLFIFITLLVKTQPKSDAKTVFLEVENLTGWSSNGIVFMIALLPGGMIITLFDAAVHMSEELPRPEKQVWQVMLITNALNAITTIAMCIALLFCLTSPENMLEPLGGMPIHQLCWDAWPNHAFVTAVVVCYVITNIIGSTTLHFTTSRIFWAFSKTGAFPFTQWISTVSSRLQVPANAVGVTGVLTIVICLLLFGPSTVQNGLFGSAAVFYMFAYDMPILLLLVKGRDSLPRNRTFNLGWPQPLLDENPFDDYDSLTLSSVSLNDGLLHTGDLGSTASVFLHHFLTSTCHRIIPASADKNPFLTHVLPLAATDELVLQSIVTLGGVHLAHKFPTPQVTEGAWHHYGSLIRMLRDVSTVEPQDFKQLLRIFLLQVLLCVIEAFTNGRMGATYFHLQASRRLVPDILHHSIGLQDRHSKTLCGFVLELYAYHSLVTVPTPYREFTLTDLDPRDDSFLQSLDRLQQYDTFGIVLGSIHPLLQHIPRIAQLAQLRQQESWSSDPSPDVLLCFNELYHEIENLQIPLDMMLRLVHQASESIILAQIYRHALSISLIDGMWGGSVFEQPQMITKLQQHAESGLDLLPLLANSKLAHISCWALVVIGSCMVTIEHREKFRHSLRRGGDVGVVQSIREVLEMMWEDKSGLFGPYGLYQYMVSNNIVLCIG
ncbi:hypothetical protein FE257_010769 [Aspergillus nanangensis]|uniref:Uncharacterized protein n=1 Tax=Aspergillus nanangensis TaxID=2582783 RepID=A0AAD4GXZ2_ASPNN|nr:hypothetical protein FE257_010769 [Aspergillus nanangensis]